ncbi:MAG: ribosome biogenesis GTPase YlqF [Acutalibacteraceae bacterium]
MSEAQNIQWFPGHMTRTKRQIQASLKLVDAVVEIIDARIPVSSRNPDLDKLLGNKPRLILMNKCDMADKRETARWIEHYKKYNIPAIPVDCKTGKGLNVFIPEVKKLLQDKINSWAEKGMKGHSIHVMIVGIPNVGKSSFINRMAKKDSAKVENRPGVTRGNQWFTIGKGFELLDTPGVLWPKFDDMLVGERLAFTGAVKDQVIDTEQLAVRLLEILKADYKTQLAERYKLDSSDFDDITAYELLQRIGKKRGFLISGGEIDTERASITLLEEFRNAKLGCITLEKI